MILISKRVSAVALILGLCAMPALAADSAKDPLLATVNGKEIRKSDLAELQQTLPPQLRQIPLEAVQDQLLEHLINSQLITAEAQKSGIQNDPKVKQRLKEIEARIMQERWLAKQAEQAVSDADIRKRYDDLLAKTPAREEIRASHILVESEEAARAVIADLNAGANFAEVAKAKSKDPSAQGNAGDLGFFTEQDMVPEFSKAAFALQPGQTTAEPVKTQFGWHVIKLEERRQAQPPKFDEVKEQIRAQMAEEAIAKVVQSLREKAQVKKFAADGAAKAK